MKEDNKTYKSFSHIMAISFSVVLSIISYSFGFSCMNNALNLMTIIFNVSEQHKGLMQGILQSSLYVGGIFGSILGLFLLRIGLRKCLIVIDLLLMSGAALLYFDNLYVFLAGRVIMGLGCGMAPSIASYYLIQYCPQELFGLIGGLNPLLISFSIGLVATQSLGFLFQASDDLVEPEQVNSYWRYYFTVLPIVICSVRLILIATYLKDETPLHYACKNKDERASEVLRKIYKSEHVLDNMMEIKNLAVVQSSKPAFFKRPYARRMYFALFLQFLAQNNGYNAVTQFSSLIFHDVFDENIAHILTLMISVIKFVVYMITIQLTQKYGRRSLLLIGNSIMILMNFAIGTLSLLSDNEEDPKIKSFQQYISIVCIFVYLVANFFSLTPLITIYVPELIPSKGAQYTWIFYWFCATYILLVFPIAKQYLGLCYCFYYFGVVTIVGQIVMHYYLIETKDATEQQIVDYYYGSRQKKIVQIQDSIASSVRESLVPSLLRQSK